VTDLPAEHRERDRRLDVVVAVDGRRDALDDLVLDERVLGHAVDLALLL